MWSSLIKLALMGTDRQTPTVAQLRSPAHPILNSILEQLNWDAPEQALLEAMGAIALYQQAGQGPAVFDVELPVPVSDLRPCCSTPTVHLLRHALNHDPDVSGEILEWVIAAGQQIPAEWLPALLDFGVRHSHVQSVINDCVGLRGRWLAAQNPAWAYAQWDWSLLPTETESHPPSALETQLQLPQPFADLWRTGTMAQRIVLVQKWRAIAPNAARQLLETGWSQEAAHARAELMAVLSTGLSLADESFLEMALTDRNSAVRMGAAHLLARLPLSSWCQRMAEWGRSLITITHQDQGLEIAIEWPTLETLAEAEPMIALGPSLPLPGSIDSAASALDLQMKGLIQVIGSTPLSQWQQHGLPSDLIQAATGQPHGAIAISGWAIATLRQQNPQWADALAQYYWSGWLAARSTSQPDTARLDWLADLLLILPLSRREALLIAYVPPTVHRQTSLLDSPLLDTWDGEEHGATDGMAIAQWLQLAIAACPKPGIDNGSRQATPAQSWRATWSQSLSQRVLAQFHRPIRDHYPSYIRQLQSLARPIALRLDPAVNDSALMATLSERIVPGSAYDQQLWHQIVEILRTIVTQRYALQKEFERILAEPPKPQTCQD